ncbi:hypothetical protein SH2C18_20910 [Clostridium sediminicola]
MEINLDDLYEFLKNPSNSKIIYLIFILFGLGLLSKIIKRILDEIKNK